MKDDRQLELLVKRLAGMGLEAIECHYPKHTQAQTAFYLELAYKYSLPTQPFLAITWAKCGLPIISPPAAASTSSIEISIPFSRKKEIKRY